MLIHSRGHNGHLLGGHFCKVPPYALVPHFNLAEVLLRTCREVQLEGKAKDAVYLTQKVKASPDLVLNLQMSER